MQSNQTDAFTMIMRVIQCVSVDQVWFLIHSNIVSRYDLEIPHSQTADKTRSIVRKSHTAITRRQKDKQSKATSSLFPIEMIGLDPQEMANTSRTSLVSVTCLMSLSDHGPSLVAFRNGPLLLLFPHLWYWGRLH